MKKTAACIFTAILAMLAASCSDEPNYDYGDFIEVFATYMGDAGSGSTLEYQAHDDSPNITLRCGKLNIEELEQGDRLFVRYTVTERRSDTDLSARIDGAIKAVYDKIRTASEETIAGQPSTPIDITSMWRTGNYINMQSWVPFVGGKFQLLLIVDEATVNEPEATATLVYNTMDQQPTFERKCLASFDITNLWQRSSLRTLHIYVDDPTGESCYTFHKTVL